MACGSMQCMDRFWGLSSTTWTGVYTLLTAGLLIVAVVAATYARRQWEAAREQAADARRAAVEAARPYVIVDVRPSAATPQLFDLVISNIGQRPALGVRVQIDPPPVRASERGSRMPLQDIKMLNEPIAMIAPQQELRTFWDNRVERDGRKDLPLIHEATVTYGDTSAREYGPEVSVLDLDAFNGAMFVKVHSVHTIGKTLDKMLNVFSNSSVLGPEGHAVVEAVVESREEHAERVAQAAKEAGV